MWKAIYIASDRAQADKLYTALTDEGILARVRESSCGGEAAFEVQVPEAGRSDAQTVLCSVGGGL